MWPAISLSSDCYTGPFRIESVVEANVADDGRKEKREKKESRWLSGNSKKTQLPDSVTYGGTNPSPPTSLGLRIEEGQGQAPLLRGLPSSSMKIEIFPANTLASSQLHTSADIVAIGKPIYWRHTRFVWHRVAWLQEKRESSEGLPMLEPNRVNAGQAGWSPVPQLLRLHRGSLTMPSRPIT
jgi:hypothetical protein